MDVHGRLIAAAMGAIWSTLVGNWVKFLVLAAMAAALYVDIT
jgi:hypothetical protein